MFKSFGINKIILLMLDSPKATSVTYGGGAGGVELPPIAEAGNVNFR